jgi:hypothetical protein
MVNNNFYFYKHIIIFIFLFIIGHFTIVLFNFNISQFFDFYILIFTLLNFKLKIEKLPYFITILSILLFSLFYSLSTNNDFDLKYLFVSLKLLVFLLLFISISFNKKILCKELDFYWTKKLFIISLFLIISDKIYLIYKNGLLLGLLERPRLIGEINFDIVIVLVLWVILKTSKIKYSKFYDYLLFFTVIITLSRSGIIAYALTIFTLQQINSKNNLLIKFLKNSFYIIFGSALILIIYFIRDPNLDFKNIDRIQIFTSFINIYNNENFSKFIFGHSILFPLPDFVCNNFKNLALTTTGDENNCNPVILLSYFLRSSYEYGILIMFLIPYFYYKNISNIKALSIIFLMPVLAASLAVGGFYNSMSILSLIFAKYFCEKNYIQNIS